MREVRVKVPNRVPDVFVPLYTFSVVHPLFAAELVKIRNIVFALEVSMSLNAQFPPPEFIEAIVFVVLEKLPCPPPVNG